MLRLVQIKLTLVFLLISSTNLDATLIILQPSSEGLVACGDHRLIDPKTFILLRDDVEKIFTARNGGVFSEGETYLKIQGERPLSINQEVRSYFSLHPFDLQNVNLFVSSVRSKLESFLESNSLFRERVSSHTDPTNKTSFLQTSFFFRDKNGFKILYGFYYFRSANAYPNRFEQHVNEIPRNDYPGKYPMIWGDGRVLTAIYEGRSGFEDLRHDPDVQQFLLTHPSPTDVSTQRVKVTLQKFIRWTNERSSLLGPPTSVSKDSSRFVLPKTGPIHKLQ